MDRPQVILTTEGTYPFHHGGVSTWCDALIHQLPEVDFIIMAVAMNPYLSLQFDIPANVKQVRAIPLWGIQDPSEQRGNLAYSEIFLQKQRTGSHEIEELFLPHLQQFLTTLVDENRSHDLGVALARMYQFFRTYDYQTALKSHAVWELYKTWLLNGAHQGYWDEPSIFESVQGLGWIYHFLSILNTAIPTADMVHSSAAAFCGMVGIVSKLEFGTPYLLTEHGVYLREQYLAIGRSNMTPFSKRFLIALVKAISRANLYFADQLVPVCAFNGRWERVLGADGAKIRVIYNGVSSRRFYPATMPGEAISSQKPIQILCVARIDPNKDLDTLLRAIHIVTSSGIAVAVRVLGSVSVESYYQTMLRLREELGLTEVVRFEGYSADISDAYREADITVQSSVSEAFPYAIIESMMSGTPLVATDVGGSREALAATGILVPSRDPAKLAAGIAILAQNPELRLRLGRAAHQRALDLFEISQAMQNFSQLYHHWQQELPIEDHASGRERAQLHVTRALLLQQMNQPALALAEYYQALTHLTDTPAVIPILLQTANLELRCGHSSRAYTHLLKLRLLESLFSRNSVQAG